MDFSTLATGGQPYSYPQGQAREYRPTYGSYATAGRHDSHLIPPQRSYIFRKQHPLSAQAPATLVLWLTPAQVRLYLQLVQKAEQKKAKDQEQDTLKQWHAEWTQSEASSNAPSRFAPHQLGCFSNQRGLI